MLLLWMCLSHRKVRLLTDWFLHFIRHRAGGILESGLPRPDVVLGIGFLNPGSSPQGLQRNHKNESSIVIVVFSQLKICGKNINTNLRSQTGLDTLGQCIIQAVFLPASGIPKDKSSALKIRKCLSKKPNFYRQLKKRQTLLLRVFKNSTTTTTHT